MLTFVSPQILTCFSLFEWSYGLDVKLIVWALCHNRTYIAHFQMCKSYYKSKIINGSTPMGVEPRVACTGFARCRAVMHCRWLFLRCWSCSYYVRWILNEVKLQWSMWLISSIYNSFLNIWVVMHVLNDEWTWVELTCYIIY